MGTRTMPGGVALRRWMAELASDVADLTLSRACVACGDIGSVLCGSCGSSLITVRRHEVSDWSRSADGGARMPPIVVAASYDGAAKAVIIAHKEHGVLGLTPILGSMLAVSIAALGDGPFVVVAIPPHRDALRRRGVDTLGAIADRAVAELRMAGWRARVTPVLRRQADGGRHVGRSAHERRIAVRGSLAVDPGVVRRVLGRPGNAGAAIVVVDDVVTTGATAGEAVRTLRASGLAVTGVAAVAGTEPRGSSDPAKSA